MGLLNGTLYSLNSGSSTVNGHVTLYTTELEGSSASKRVLTWNYKAKDSEDEFLAVSDLFGYRSKIWFLAATDAVNKDGSRGKFADGSGEKISLVQMDPARGAVRRTPVTKYAGSIYASADEQSNVAIAARRGHAYDGNLYSIDKYGAILKISLDDGELSTVGKVSKKRLRADFAVASWAEDRVSILRGQSGVSASHLETYSLLDGSLIGDVTVTGIAELRDRLGAEVWDFEMLPD